MADHVSEWVEEEDGWYVPTCSCGWQFGPVPDVETLVDALMGHAWEIGREAGLELAREQARQEEAGS